jgi:Pyruvate/2-oxoacid:ferredoxin oxidoreductase delta subunit
MKTFEEIKAEMEEEQTARTARNTNYETKKNNVQKRDREPCRHCGSYCFGSCLIY